MKRVVILGRGASGKSTLAKRLGEITGLPLVELDQVFWRPGLVAMRREDWIAAQNLLVAQDGWILDGDLGPLDVVETRLRAADTIFFLDFSFFCCAHRALQRSRERIDFWWWVLSYRWRSRPALLKAIADYAPDAELHVFRKPDSLQRFLHQFVSKA